MNDQSLIHRLHHLTYSDMRIKDRTLDGNLPSQKCQPQVDLPPRKTVGVLDSLPLELLHQVLAQLDLSTLTDFRRVNRRALLLVNSLPEYRAINTHAPNALRGILSIRTGKWITCRTLYEKLCTAECEQCGDFGSYLYLLTCKRVCFLCFSEHKSYLPLPPMRARRKFGLDGRIVNTLPCMRVIPGTYSPNEKKVRTSSVLVDHDSAFRAGISLHGSLSAMRNYVADVEAQKLDAYKTRVAERQQSGSITRRTRQPGSSDPFDGLTGNPFRFVAIANVPWWNKSLREVEWGVYCVGCENSKRRPLHYRQKYTIASFDDHLKRFGDIQDGQHHLS